MDMDDGPSTTKKLRTNMHPDDEVGELLDKWNLQELISVFKEHCITNIDILNDLTPELMTELVPQIGLRIKLKNNLDELRSKKNIIIIETDETYSTTETDKSFNEIIQTVDVFPHATVGFTEAQIVQAPFYRHKVECAKKTGLEDLINSTVRGRMIMGAYKKNKEQLTGEYRNKLVELIIEHELENDLDKRISCEKFEEWAEAISAVLPNEYKEVYFMKVFHRTRNGRSNYIGRGKLFAKYYNFRKHLKECGLMSKNKSSLNTDLIHESDIGDDLYYPDGTTNNKQSEYIEWLKNNKQPEDKVLEYWELTFDQRKQILKEKDIFEYYKLFPALGQARGYILFNIDFTRLYPDKDIAYSNWPRFAEKLIRFATHSNEKRVKAQLNEIENSITEEGRQVRTLKLLPSLLTPVAITRKWKPSKQEVDEAFIIHVKVIQDLQHTIKAREEKLQQFKLRFQPTPIIVGSDLDNINTCYVRVDTILYEVETPLKAIEVTYKAIHSLNALYPTEAEQVWLVIQKALFLQDTPFDRHFTAVSTIVPSLK